MTPDSELHWFSSDRSGNDPNKTNCVEVAFIGKGARLRDSKHIEGGSFELSDAGWMAMLTVIDQGFE